MIMYTLLIHRTSYCRITTILCNCTCLRKFLRSKYAMIQSQENIIGIA